MKILTTQRIVVSRTFFKKNGNRVEYPIPQILVNEASAEEIEETWTHILDKNYERFLPESLVDVIEKLGYFAFAHIYRNGCDETFAEIHICSNKRMDFIRTAEVDTSNGNAWHNLKGVTPKKCVEAEVRFFFDHQIFFRDTAADVDEQIKTTKLNEFDFENKGEDFTITGGQVLFDLLELRLRRLLDSQQR